MNFQHPYFLWALLAIAIPIIIHLFNFRKYTTIVFSSIRFLKEVKEETQKQSQLKHLLILLSRILAIVCLVIAFAQPFIPAKQKSNSNNIIGIYIDNSFSMNAIGKNGNLLEQAKKRATEIVKTHGATTKYKLVTNSFEGKHQRIVNQEQIFEFINEVTTTGNSKSLYEITTRLHNTSSAYSNHTKSNYLISDFQYNKPDLESITTDSTKQYSIIKLDAVLNSNVYIDSCWFENPVHKINTPEILKFRLKNTGSSNIDNIPIKLYVNKKQKALTNETINANSSIVGQVSFTNTNAGWQQAQLKIDDYPITFDNTLNFSFKTDSATRILAINQNEPNSSLKKLYGTDDFFEFNNKNVSRLNYAEFKNYKTIIINELTNINSGLATELEKYLKDGGKLVIIPGEKINIDSYKEFLLSINCNYYTNLDTTNTAVQKINTNHTIYRNVFSKLPNNIELPIIYSHYNLDGSFKNGSENLLPLKNKNQLLNSYKYRKGIVYLFTSPLNSKSNNFTKHGIFVPTLFNIALINNQSNLLYYTVGETNTLNINESESNFPFILKKQNIEVIPGYKQNKILTNSITESGNYNLTQNELSIKSVSFNYSRNESNNSFLSIDELKKIQPTFTFFENSETIASQIEKLSKGTQLWKTCVILCLVFLIIEIALIRYFNRVN